MMEDKREGESRAINRPCDDMNSPEWKERAFVSEGKVVLLLQDCIEVGLIVLRDDSYYSVEIDAT
jgi:hypothetical protein